VKSPFTAMMCAEAAAYKLILFSNFFFSSAVYGFPSVLLNELVEIGCTNFSIVA
jgi:hypothetical protein